MKRTKIKDRCLPKYCKQEEILNAISHGIGASVAIAALILCVIKSGDFLALTGALIYGISLFLVYGISATYHGFPAGNIKKYLQVADHCTIYALIAGTYTPILLCCFVHQQPVLGWGLLAFQWGTAVVCVILNLYDLKRFWVISMISYIVMGWAIIFFVPYALQLIPGQGFLYILAGGISYTLGAILYGIGAKKPWFHSIFHIFVLLGSVLQFIAIYYFIM